jgi:hypothetical protein
MSRLNTVNIRPGVNVLSVLPHLKERLINAFGCADVAA